MGLARLWPIVLVIIGASSYGLLSPVIKLAYEAGFGDRQVTVSQMTVGTLIMWGLILANPKAWSNPFRGPWVQLSLIGILGLAMTTLLYNLSLSKLNASLSIVLLFQFTWITIVMEAVAKRRRPGIGRIASLLLIGLGTVMAVHIGWSDWSRFSPVGLLAGLGSAVSYSLYLFWSGNVRSTFSPLLKSVIMLTAGMLFMFLIDPPGLLLGSGSTGRLLLWGCLLGLLGQVIPTFTFMVGIPKIGSTLAALLGSMELPVAIVSAYLLLHEQIVPAQWTGMALILAGIVLANRAGGDTVTESERTKAR